MAGTQTDGRSISDTAGDVAAVVLGVAAFLASALHVYAVCIRVAGPDPRGSDRLVAVLITVGIELLAAVAMLELRKGFRWVPFGGLLLGIALTGAANLASRRDNGAGWGWPETVAIAPAVLFLTVLAIVETRPERKRPARKPATRAATGHVATAGQPAPKLATVTAGQPASPPRLVAIHDGQASAAAISKPATASAVEVATDAADGLVLCPGGPNQDRGCGRVSARTARRHKVHGCPKSEEGTG